MPSFIEPGLATELVVNKSKFSALPKDLQHIVEIACQAEYDQVASDFYANNPIALKTLVEQHGVNIRYFPDDVLEAGAKASMDIINELREHKDALTRETTESFIKSLNILRTRTENIDQAFVLARQKYIKYS
jgi:TRAP-type mannitol/chloroaromatic compound transport system substrate-binding protein